MLSEHDRLLAALTCAPVSLDDDELVQLKIESIQPIRVEMEFRLERLGYRVGV